MIAGWALVIVMLLAATAVFSALPKASDVKHESTMLYATDPRVAGLVSTRTLTHDEIANDNPSTKEPDMPEPQQTYNYDNEIVVTRVIENAVHVMAVTPIPKESHGDIVAETDDRLLAVDNSQLISPQPTPVSPLPTPISPLATPDPPTPQDAGDVYAFVQTIVDAQNSYYTEHGAYAQVIFGESPSCPGDCINLAYPDGIAVAVNVYTSPSGDGYEIVIINAGWQITVNHGPESYRSTGWRRNEP